MPVHVLLADDNARFRAALRRLLERDPDIAVVGEAGDGREALELVARVAPDLVLMDVSMPDVGGLEAASRLTDLHPDVAVLMLSIGCQSDTVAAALAGGASGFLVKGTPAREIADAVKRHGRAGPRRDVAARP